MENPKIRFKGFTKDWEQRKWMNSVDISTEMVDPASGEYDDMPHIAPGNIESFTGRVLDNVRTVKEEQLISGKFRFRPDDVVYGKINPQLGKYFYASVDGLTSADAYVFKGKNGITQKFLFSLLQTSDFFKYSVSVSKRSGMPKINRDELNAYAFLAPSEEEQDKIGNFLLELDHLITLHQRKCEQTKKLKKYMLQKMFPQNGEKIPKIRFDGFTYDWEQRKLGDVFEQTSNLVNPKEDEIELWSLTVEDGLTQKSDRYNREFLVKKDDNFKEVRPGDIVYNPMNMTLGAVGYNGMAKSVAVSGYYTTMVAKENYDTYYINTWLKSPQAIRLYRTYATGSLIEKQRVQFPTLSIIPVTFPKYEEQTKIGSYFHSLDHLITLHQRKCDELKKMKKYMLQNMFI